MAHVLEQLSGRWSGYWLLRPDEFPEALELVFFDGKVLGFGKDLDGDFQMLGDYDDQNGVYITKLYTSPARGDVIPKRLLIGGWDGRRMSGGWFDARTTRTCGGFHLWPGRGPEPKYLTPDEKFTWESILQPREQP